MKSRIKKQEELKRADGLFAKSKALLFVDFSGIDTSRLRELRTAVRNAGGALMVVKKRLLNVLFKEKGVSYDARQFGGSVGTIFSERAYEETSAPVYRFFAALPETETQKKTDHVKKILGAYDVGGGQIIGAETVRMIGQLPPREVLLAHVLGTIVAPLRAFMYLLDQKAKISPAAVSQASQAEVVQAENKISEQEPEIPTQTVEPT